MYFKTYLEYCIRNFLQHFLGHAICIFTDGIPQAWDFLNYLYDFSNSLLRLYSSTYWITLCSTAPSQQEEKN